MFPENTLAAVQQRFESAGGQFVKAATDIAAAALECRGVVFDWDGVFNAGHKGEGTHSGFSEADSMGTNMLRYGLWRRSGSLPFAAIISGEKNPTAIRFAEREHFDAVFTGIRDKRQVIEKISAEHGIAAGQLICVFDDINDLGMAGMCGLRFMVRRDASPMLAEFAVGNELCDYVTGSPDYAVREVCELLLGLTETYGDVVQSRIDVDDDYQRYFAERQAVECQT